MTEPQDSAAVSGPVLGVLDRLDETAAEFELPAPSETFQTYRRKLRENRYTVLVAGEAKRGKSSLINAILGRKVLPTGVDVTTCQVFRIRQAPEEAYRVRFEDDSALPIKARDLPKYGSQVLADAGEAPRLDQMVRWIEIDAPIRFLPKEITLLDTPGLGSLYKAHERIIRRFVPLADAVVFVLHSDSPIGPEEVEFLNEFLKVTSSILFVQTKIDLYKREKWQDVKARNEQILDEKFGDRLPDRRTWPISNENLMKGVERGDDDYVDVSLVRPLATALQKFLVRVAVWGRAAEAIVLARDYHRAGADLLRFRLDALTEESAAARAARQAGIAGRRRQFEDDWGPKGLKRGQLLKDVAKVVRLGKEEFAQRIRYPNGAIHDDYLQRIDALANLDQARALAVTMAEQVVKDADTAWDDVCQRARQQVTELLTPFVVAVEVGITVPETPELRQVLTTVQAPTVRQDLYGKARSALQEGGFAFSKVAGGASLAALLFGTTLVASSLFLPVAVLGALGAGLYGMLRGIDLSSTRQLQDARQLLRNHLQRVLLRVNHHFGDVDHGAGRFGLVDEYFETLKERVTDHLETTAEQKLRDARNELSRLAEEAALDDRQRQRKADQLVQQINTWGAIETKVLDLVQELARLEQSYQTRPETVAQTT